MNVSEADKGRYIAAKSRLAQAKSSMLQKNNLTSQACVYVPHHQYVRNVTDGEIDHSIGVRLHTSKHRKILRESPPACGLRTKYRYVCVLWPGRF